MEIDIKKIAVLASLEISEEEERAFSETFSEIVDMVSELPELSDAEPYVDRMELRDDTIESCGISRSGLMDNAPQSVNGYFAVPRTVEQ
ncbi:MAG: Asp-tRNA(Asn)/Glu-tRNA(Gln) amidotransferase subunit GatC [Ruminococcus sp.]|uniref:Asp-tRNA(Asn)/Glu-tRNA(Gln) amidotransferase subunit GatC n=1 Tax=Ruminococcus sp. TaxID=41978 RepID=UPI0025E85728|nr:Asp-tRNA(Asn)/Glu-tRNA(Gln) amidotransferase subunit GatC [Ruminococcus sp.]MCR5601683.1 Asp-tRNA(Asn)/Glu-tRNA(Gln) amidotransferase subunit GatC [Ruminococcus sp.]